MLAELRTKGLRKVYKLAHILEGWDGYQTSLLHAVSPLGPEQLRLRPAAGSRSIGEVIRHIALGRITWLARIEAVGVDAITLRVSQWFTDADGSRHVSEKAVPSDHADALKEWLVLSWQPIRQSLDAWTEDDLFQTYPHRFRGVDYRLSRQWVVWRILSHDLHHGGQIALMLAMNGIEAFELRSLGGHIIQPPLLNPAV